MDIVGSVNLLMCLISDVLIKFYNFYVKYVLHDTINTGIIMAAQ